MEKINESGVPYNYNDYFYFSSFFLLIFFIPNDTECPSGYSVSFLKDTLSNDSLLYDSLYLELSF